METTDSPHGDCRPGGRPSPHRRQVDSLVSGWRPEGPWGPSPRATRWRRAAVEPVARTADPAADDRQDARPTEAEICPMDAAGGGAIDSPGDASPAADSDRRGVPQAVGVYRSKAEEAGL